eukprot:GFUD01011465.1.p1 GENE.GFUD01011465.1~~GFUD01011465.1.p1  ORF type:complete len:777 (+),score=122.67 GFUD01011465.1:174-2504(+)
MFSTKLFVFLALQSRLTTSTDNDEYTKEWAVEIEGGSETAEAIAKQIGLDLLAEVIPDSNIFHFRHKRLAKRSAEDVKENLLQHPGVKSTLHQKVNKRVKRDLVERELSVREQCFVSTIETATEPSKRCVFPFQYKGSLYQRCTSDHSTNGEQWCATSVTRDGSVIVGEWGDCDFANIECRVLPPEPSSRPIPPPDSSVLSPGSLLSPELTGPISTRKALPVRPHIESQDNSIEELLEINRSQAIEVRPKTNPLPPQQPRLPMGTRRLPATLDEFLLLLGPRRPPPRPIVLDAREDEDDVPKDAMARFTDKEWPRQWYLNRGGNLDMNVEEAWDMGYSGKGVTVTILDDGVEWNHPDLKDNYVEAASYDINANDKDPFPRYDLFDTNKHGTRCAGQVSAQANNSVCSVGIAFNSGIGGVRMLDGTITDAVEARSLSLNPQNIDIYSASWGPDDDGQTVDGPGPLTRRALEEGANKGRNGLGSIYVWASGNGGKFQDNCNCDGYATSIFTLSVSSASENGNIPWYSEQCSSTLATTYSSGSSRQGERKVITTDLHGRCTSSHTGTSASSPMAAGIIALILEANPSLNWRDVQHIVVRSARHANLKADDWNTNGAGYNVSHAFGFGLMDAGLMVKKALVWKKVPEQQKCEVEFSEGELSIGGRGQKELSLSVTDCKNVQFLEHVHVMVDISSRSRRGEFTIQLKSPSGTLSKLLAPRPLDNSISGFANFRTWPLMTTHTWGENPAGTWRLVVGNGGDRTAYVGGWKLILYGTKTDHNQ